MFYMFSVMAIASTPDSKQPSTFYGYTPAQTQKWVNEAPNTPPKKFAVVEGAGSNDNVQCSVGSSSKETKTHRKHIRRAIKLGAHNPMQALKGHAPDGGFFGAVIYKDGKILGEGWNTVLKEGDPSRHGEMNAIRQATHG